MNVQHSSRFRKSERNDTFFFIYFGGFVCMHFKSKGWGDGSADKGAWLQTWPSDHPTPRTYLVEGEDGLLHFILGTPGGQENPDRKEELETPPDYTVLFSGSQGMPCSWTRNLVITWGHICAESRILSLIQWIVVAVGPRNLCFGCTLKLGSLKFCWYKKHKKPTKYQWTNFKLNRPALGFTAAIEIGGPEGSQESRNR